MRGCSALCCAECESTAPCSRAACSAGQLIVLVCAQVQPMVAGSAPVVSQLKVKAVLKELSNKAQVHNADLWNAR